MANGRFRKLVTGASLKLAKRYERWISSSLGQSCRPERQPDTSSVAKGVLKITASGFFNKAYLIAPTTGCVHAVSNSSATLPFTFAFEEITRART